MAGKRVHNLFASVVDFTHLHRSAWKARKGIQMNADLANFFFHLESNILLLQQELMENRYTPSPFRCFVITDPKPRLIQAAPFRDRVVHHALCSVLQPHLERSYLADSYACQKNKGNHKAVQRVHSLIKKFQWVGKLDIHHFFETLHHPTLYTMLSKRIADTQILDLTKAIISHGRSTKCFDRGVPIGNLTSQHFANFYLDRLDHYIIEQTPIQAIVRYMDDIIVFANTHRAMIDAFSLIDDFVQSTLQLQLKDSQTRLNQSHRGISFLGFRLYPHKIHFDQKRKKRFVQKWNANFLHTPIARTPRKIHELTFGLGRTNIPSSIA